MAKPNRKVRSLAGQQRGKAATPASKAPTAPSTFTPAPTGGSPAPQGGGFTAQGQTNDPLGGLMGQNPLMAMLMKAFGGGDQWPRQGLGSGISQVDVRTPFMQMLEMASGPVLLQSLLNPGGIPQMLGLPTMNSQGPQNLLASLFGAGAPGGSPPVQMLANGGQLRDDMVNVVGELGPEMIIGDQVLPMNSGQFRSTTQQGPGTGAGQLPTVASFGGGGGWMDRIQNPLAPMPTNPAAPTTGGTHTPAGPTGTPAPTPTPGTGPAPGGGTPGGVGGMGGWAEILGQNLFQNNPAAGVISALEPVFQRNLDYALGQLSNRAPSVMNSGFAMEGTNLAQNALQDFVLQMANAQQTGLNQQIQGMGTLGTLGLQGQQQAFDQQWGPIMALLMAALQSATPTGQQTVVTG